MQASRAGLPCSLLFALSAIIVSPQIARAQDMPPIWTPVAPPPAATAPATPAVSAPSAQAAVPPAVIAPPAPPPAKKQVVAARATKPRPEAKVAAARRQAKFAALTKRLTAAVHAHPAPRRVVAAAPEPALPRGAIVPPPGYYYPPAPYEQLVYGGPPRGGWGGYRGRYPY